nr:DUF4332 domain-containing protein [Synechococcus sp. GFB01]
MPPHFAREQRRLEAAGIRGWQALAELDDASLRLLAADGASEQRLRRLRGQALLVEQVGLEPQVAALLLHAGIATPVGLAGSDPQWLQRQVGRLRRNLLGAAAPGPSLGTVQGWINQARRATN